MTTLERTADPDARGERLLSLDADSLDPRSIRALTERMTVRLLPDGRYAVESASGATYVVDREVRSCTCPDHEIRGVRCKHLRRVAFEIAEGTVPGPWQRRPCASCGRRTETEGAPPLCADCRLEPGDLVRDRESGNPLLVVGTPSERASAVTVPESDHTVAEHPSNAGYAPDDAVVEVVYPYAVVPDEQPRRYRFPRSRLERVEPDPDEQQTRQSEGPA